MESQNQTLAIVAVVISSAGAIFTALNHTRVRSACCGRKLEISLDVDKTTPTPAIPLVLPVTTHS